MARASGYKQPTRWKTTTQRILDRDDHTCYGYAPTVCTGEASSVDHLIPVSQGGTHRDSNLAAICGTCHKLKSEAERVAGLAAYRARNSRNRPHEAHPGALTL